MWHDIVIVMFPFVCGVIAGVIVAYPRGFRRGYAQAKNLLPKMVQAAVEETFNVERGSSDGEKPI